MRMAATAAVYNRLHNSSVGGGGSGGGGLCGGGMAHSQLARSLERILEEAHLSGELILANRKLKDFPKTCTKYNLADTVMADLSRNRFCELPEEITSFSFLETLLVYHNAIRCIPESVKHLTSLTYLDLRSNQLGTLPREICFLPLQVLLVSNNRLTALPDELGRMERLTDLDASYNQLTTLPARIGELRSLRSLSLRSNQLMYLPRELTCLTLVSLDVSNNRIASLPLEIRQMSTLVDLNLENNPLTSPPASLCVRGLVHVFKFLETQAAKDEKGSRAGGNYDGYTTLRRAPRYNANGTVLDSNRVPRHHVDSGYSTCDGIDKRWSHDLPSVKPKLESPTRRTPTTPPSSLCSELMDASLTSSSSTIVDEPMSVPVTVAAVVVKPLNVEALTSPLKHKDSVGQQPPTTLHQHINYGHSSSSGSSPDQDDLGINHQNHSANGKPDEKFNKDLGNIQTYREYKEALKQLRNQEVSSVYKMKDQKVLYDMSEASNALNTNNVTLSQEYSEVIRVNGSNNTQCAVMPKSIMKNGSNGTTNTATLMNGVNNGGEDSVIIPKKPVQKVIPSRNTEIMSSQTASKAQTEDMEKTGLRTNGDCIGYVKPNSPMKGLNGNTSGGCSGILTNNKFVAVSGIKSPVSNATKIGTTKTHRTVTWNHDIPPEKLSFTMRREFDRQREETELMTQLRSIIETRLKMTLPEDIASALTDGVILCHLANYVHPRSVASIHVPSPGVSKLTMARCRRNVDNFLEACRKIGVDEELICSCADVVPPSEDDYNSNGNFNRENNNELNGLYEKRENPLKLPNPSAVLTTVSALMAMDLNPHHQNTRSLQQQYALHKRQREQQPINEQQDNNHQHQNNQAECDSRSVLEDCYENSEHIQQLSATSTKEQMQQQEDLDNSTLELRAKCHCDSDVVDDNNCANNADFNYDDVDVYVVADDSSMLQKPESVRNVKNFFRHAKLKALKKIKFNTTPSHLCEDTCNGVTATNNNLSTLHTIVEAESEVNLGGEGAYQLINEKPYTNDELQLKVESKSLDAGGNKYKLVDLPATHKRESTDKENASESAIMVKKRIEFFEHSSSATTSIKVSTTSPSESCAGITAKSLAKNTVFSIYRVADMCEEKLVKNEAEGKEAGTPFLLRHDSHTLTIILSCIFIATFLILVFFPLPG